MADLLQLSKELKFLDHFVCSVVGFPEKTGDFSVEDFSCCIDVLQRCIINLLCWEFDLKYSLVKIFLILLFV